MTRRSVRVRIAVFAAVGGLVACSIGASSDAPATRPAGPASTRPASDTPVRLRDLFGADVDANRQDPPSAEEWADIAKFSKENFPNRWSLFEKVAAARGDNSPLVNRLKLRVANKYRALTRIQASGMRRFYDTALEEAHFDDQAYGASLDVRKNPNDSDARQRLKQSVSDLVRVVLNAREARLDRLRDMMAVEQQQLDHDKDDVDGLIDRQVDRLVNGTPGEDLDRARNWRPFGARGPFGGPGGPGGFGGPGGGGPPPGTQPAGATP